MSEVSRQRRFSRWIANVLTKRWALIFLISSAVLIAIACVGFFWISLPTGIVVGSPPIAIDDFENALDQAMTRCLDNFNLWYKANILIQILLMTTAILATILASVTRSDNADRIKKWSIFLTATTAGLTTAQSTFHMRENIETFVKSTSSLYLLEMEYLVQRAPFDEELRKNMTDNKTIIPTGLKEIQRQFAPRYAAILSDRMRAWANVGQQSALPNQSVPSDNGQAAPRAGK